MDPEVAKIVVRSKFEHRVFDKGLHHWGFVHREIVAKFVLHGVGIGRALNAHLGLGEIAEDQVGVFRANGRRHFGQHIAPVPGVQDQVIDARNQPKMFFGDCYGHHALPIVPNHRSKRARAQPPVPGHI